jgi:transposase
MNADFRYRRSYIPGIGDILGPSIPGEIGNVDWFSSVKKLIAFAGLDPVVSKSGRMENKTGPISKRDFPLLRHALFLILFNFSG